MKNTGPARAPTLRKSLLAAVALGALPLSAFARDLPPTPEGVRKLDDLFSTYLGKPAAGASPSVAVASDGGHYAVTLDLAGLIDPLMKATGGSFDSASVKYALTEQDDGTWRVTSDSIPRLSFRMQDAQYSYTISDYRFDGLFDPALPGFRSGQVSIGKYGLELHSPAIVETFVGVSGRATTAATPAPNGAVSFIAHQEIADVSVNAVVTPGGDSAAKSTAISMQSKPTTVDVSLDNAPVRKLLELWAFLVAHPSRAEIAADEPAFKALLRALTPADFKLSERADLQAIAVGAPQGTFAVTDGKLLLAASTGVGPKGAAEYGFAIEGLKLPPGLLPPAMSDLVPTAFNVGMRASGFDAGAGASEAIEDMRLAGDGPVLSDGDRAKIFARMKGTGPVLVELLPSHIVAPQIDVALEGQAHFEGARPSGVLKVHARNFDNTIAAIKALGPLATPQVLGGLALAKGLAKSEPDGSLTWVAEYGADGAINVNGMPLGKGP
ncbi:MAG: hypothetical protein ABR970_08780 [Roseiarcus sp.]|jgi:hypothetical protein